MKNNVYFSFLKLWAKIKPVNSVLFPLVVALAYFFLFVEIITYPGFVQNYFIFPKKLVLVLAALSSILYLISNIEEKINNSLAELVINLSRISVIPLMLIYIALISIENSNYPNYVYSTYHIHINEIGILLFFTIFLSLLFLKYSKSLIQHLFKEKKTTEKKILTFFTLLVVGIYLTSQTLSIFNILIVNVEYIAKNPFASYDQKMTHKYPVVYPYLKFVTEVTPENATIAIPPQASPWLSVGNPYLSTYFLYPRKVLRPSEGKLDSSADYFMLAKGSWPTLETPHGWPKESLNISEIILYDQGEIKYLSDQNIYYPAEHSHNWGILVP